MYNLKSALTRQLPARTFVLAVATVFLVVGAVELKALKAKEPSVDHTRKFNAAECVRCHSDQKSISVMRMKEDGGGYLFNSDGTFKDPSLAKLNPQNTQKSGTGSSRNGDKATIPGQSK